MSNSITISAKALRAVLDDIAGVIERRNAIPVLSGVLLQASGGTLSLRGTDLDIQMAASVPCGGDGSFATVVSDALGFAAIIGKAPADAEVTLSLDDGRLLCRYGRSRFKLFVLPVDDFPVVAAKDYAAHFTVPAAALAAQFGAVRFAISREEARYYLCGIFWHAREEEGAARLIAAATDGARLGKQWIDAPEGAQAMPDVIVGRKTVAILDKLLGKATAAAKDAAVSVSVSDKAVRFELAGADGAAIDLTSKVIDGTFPDYSRVIPAANDLLLTIEAQALEQALGRVATVSEGKVRAVKLDLAQDRLTLSVTSPEHGEAVEEVPASYEAAPLKIGVNSRYLIEILSQIETAEMRFADAAAPIRIEGLGRADRLYVLMPLRV